MDEYIRFSNITKKFPGQTALENISFSINKGEIHALLGENGAGKSTLVNILHGLLSPTEGTVYIGDEESLFKSPQEAIDAGIIKVHQEICLVPEMTVMQNLFLGNETSKGVLLNKSQMNRRTTDILNTLRCNFSAQDKVSTLNVGQKQILQIAKAIHLNARIITFDEPTSSLSTKETEVLYEVIENLRNQGITILYISHKLDEIYRLCDRASILRDGHYQGTYEVKNLDRSVLIRNMVGRNVEMFAKRHKPRCADYNTRVLEVENLSGIDGMKNVSFKLYKGEILGFFGLVGAKRTETMMGIFGAGRITGGQVKLNGKAIRMKSPKDAIAHGIGLLPENRKEVGFVQELKNYENIALSTLKKFDEHYFQSKHKKVQNALELGKAVDLSPNDPFYMTKELSGGNQQKVIIAKWLTTDADILIFDEPTKGIDVGSKAEIYALMEELVAKGKSIIMISSELPEVLGMSDRIVVMHEGSVISTLNNEGLSEPEVLAYAVGEVKGYE